nr:NAD-dependent protein deacylase [uncultured Anaerostipes sp.]
MDQEKISRLQQMIDDSHRIVFFGGAGVSTESHIPDFRSTDGLYHQTYQYPPEVMVSHSFYAQHTEEFYDFYKNKMVFLDAEPNKAHKKLAELEAAGKLSAIVTQNIDGLHQKAGSKNVYELHGSVHRNYCVKCHKFFDAEYVVSAKGVPHCDDCQGIVKPDVVLYEESLDGNVMQGAINAIANADMLIIGGTSLVVYPAAGMIDYFRGKYLAVLNRDATSRDRQADLCITDPIGEVLGQIAVR